MNRIKMFFTDKVNLICFVALALCVTALLALNAHVLDVTRGCYNLIEIVLT